MNPIEIYKRLPKTNCRKCPPGTCMGLAVGIVRGDLRAEDCPELSPEDQAVVQGLVPRPSDWRVDLVNSLLEDLKAVDLASRQEPLGLLHASDRDCSLIYMGRQIGVDGTQVGPALDLWDQILVLRYLLGRGGVKPSGIWKAFRDLRDGSVKAEGFRKECERPLAQAFEHLGPETLQKRLQTLGGTPAFGQVAPLALEIRPLPRVPLLLLVWPGDTDFGADAKILLDETATSFLDVESLIFLGEQLVTYLESTE